RGAVAAGDAWGTADAGDVQSAAAVCAQLGIEHRVLDLRQQFLELVIDPFVRSYQLGETPNPCISCNREIKFGVLLRYAREQGFDFLATGHYARLQWQASRQAWQLLKALDEQKDQSYVLYQLRQADLTYLQFPLGELTKQQVRELAVAHQLVAAHRLESQDICFIPDGDYQSWLRRQSELRPDLPAELAAATPPMPAAASAPAVTPTSCAPGEIVDAQGQVLGRHSGIANFTIGQRHGLGLALGQPLYVTKIDADKNRITVGWHGDLLHRKCLLRDFTTPQPELPTSGQTVGAKYRYRSPEAPARLLQFDDGRWEVQFTEPQPALTPGQSLVCYQAEQVLAGGIIDEVRG
ncbi:MAG: tRNA 2-thiouridine(34) synthase MnmA, partial [Actinomycetia bacterium]|nr:tRNA 2-thiouridine(34) synthase MnmA [Actinomycetes bacterium]